MTTPAIDAAPAAGPGPAPGAGRIAAACLPGGGTPCQDAVLATDRLLLVLDGLTSPATLGTGCVHGTPWYVGRLAARIAERADARPDAGLPEVLADAIDAVRAEHAGHCDLRHPGTPCATVGMARLRPGGALDYLVLSDCTALIRTRGGVLTLTDRRAEQMAPDLQAEVKAAAYGSAQRARLTDRWITLQRGYRNRPGGYWLAAATPEAAAHARTGALEPGAATAAAVLTDGAAAFLDYRLGDSAHALQVAAGDPHALLAQVRAFEAGDPACRTHPRWKRHDDAAVAAWTHLA